MELINLTIFNKLTPNLFLLQKNQKTKFIFVFSEININRLNLI